MAGMGPPHCCTPRGWTVPNGALRQLDEAQPLVERLEAMADELARLVEGLSIEALREQAAGAASLR